MYYQTTSLRGEPNGFDVAIWSSFVFAHTLIAVPQSPAAEFPRTIEKAAERRNGFPQTLVSRIFTCSGNPPRKRAFPYFQCLSSKDLIRHGFAVPPDADARAFGPP